MRNKKFKVAVIGCGAVGMSCVYAMINQKLATDYLLIDINKSVVQGNVDDLRDCRVLLDHSFNSINVGTYSDLSDVDLLIISAGKPPVKNKSRLEELDVNANIMKVIATKVKSSGFQGLTIIISNPVDIMSTLYQKITSFPIEKVLGSGTQLDTARLNIKLANMLAVPLKDVKSYVMGEHGDSAVPVWSWTTISKKPILKYFKHLKRDPKILKTWHQEQMKDVFKIVKNKGNTCYGIGASVAKLVRNITTHTKEEVIISTFYTLPSETSSKLPGFYIGQVAHLNADGWTLAKKDPLNESEQADLDASCKMIAKFTKAIFK